MSDRTLRPLALGDIFDEGFDLYKRNFLLFLLITAVWIVPLYIIHAVVTAHLGHDLFQIDVASGDSVDAVDPTIRRFEELALIFFVSPLTTGVVWSALTVAAGNRYLDREVTLKSAYTLPLRRLLPLLAAAVLTGGALAAGSILCFVGAVWPLVTLAFTAHTFLLEKKSAWAALKRSNALVSGESGRVLSALLLLMGFGALLAAGFGVLVNYVLGLLMHLIPGSGDVTSGALMGNGPVKSDRVLNDLALGITQVVLLPFAVSLLTVLYFDLRVRKEAYDIELAAEDLGYPPLDIAAISSNGYMPPVMPGPVMMSVNPAPPAWGAPGHASPQGWGTPNQGPPPGWGPPNQGPPPGWGPPNQGPPPGWGPPNQGPSPNQGPQGWGGQPPPNQGPGWGGQSPQQQGFGAPGPAPAPGWTPPGQPDPPPPAWAPTVQGGPAAPGQAPVSAPPSPESAGAGHDPEGPA